MAYVHPLPGSGTETGTYSSRNPIRGSIQPADSGARSQIYDPLSTNHTQISMAHSMAITPVASMSSAVYTAPLAQGPGSAPNAPTTMSLQPVPMYNPPPNHLATDWDVGNLLMMQMGYTNYEPNVPQFNMGASLASQQANIGAAQMQQTLGLNTNNNPLPQQGNMNRVILQHDASVHPSSQIGAQEYASSSPESFGNTEDLLSLFSDVPMAFRCVSLARFFICCF